MSSQIEVENSTLATLVENYLVTAKERYLTGLDEEAARRVERLKEYKSSFLMRLFFKSPPPVKDVEAGARESWHYQYLCYYARRMAFVERFRSIINDPSRAKKILLSVEDHQRLIDCDVIYDYDITGNYGKFMIKEDWM